MSVCIYVMYERQEFLTFTNYLFEVKYMITPMIMPMITPMITMMITLMITLIITLMITEGANGAAQAPPGCCSW